MAHHVIQNPVPTPEQMADILGVSPDRLAAIRRIMSEPVRRKPARAFAMPTSVKFARKRTLADAAGKPGLPRVKRAKSKKN